MSEGLALILAGGGARGAYQVGVCQALFEMTMRAFGKPPPLDVICGTSIGGINGCALAASIDEPREALHRLAARWEALALAEVIRPERRRVWAMVRALVGHPARRPSEKVRGGGILDPAPLEQLVASSIAFARIAEHLRKGRLRGVTITASRLPRFRPVVFAQVARGSGLPLELAERGVRLARLRPVHALASGAIPFLFPAVEIGGALYCDGGVRQNVPLFPAIELGCDALVVVNLRRRGADSADALPADAPPSPLGLLGGLFDATIGERVEDDLARVEQVNRIVAAGEARFGPGFLSDINEALVAAGERPVGPVRILELGLDRDLGALTEAFVRDDLERRAHGLTGHLLVRMAEQGDASEVDLLSYMLFDGRYAAELIRCGRSDAEVREEAILAFFDAEWRRRAGEPGHVPRKRRRSGRFAR